MVMADLSSNAIRASRSHFAVTASSPVPEGIDTELFQCTGPEQHIIRAKTDPMECPHCTGETRQAPRAVALQYGRKKT